jgi:predicted DNA-binding transcriptional regulator AlpA
MNESCLVTATEAARQLGMARSSLYRLATRGCIPSYAAGPQLTGRRFDVQEIRSVLKEAAKAKSLAVNGMGSAA